MFDLIISQHAVSWKAKLNKDGSLPDTIIFGSSILTKKDSVDLSTSKLHMQRHLNAFYWSFHEEIVVLIERLWFLYLENYVGVDHIEMAQCWGNCSKELKELQKCLDLHMEGDYTPNQEAFDKAYKAMTDNDLQSLDF